jgi:ATP phosphoribosyltransferase regulatory subunit
MPLASWDRYEFDSARASRSHYDGHRPDAVFSLLPRDKIYSRGGPFAGRRSIAEEPNSMSEAQDKALLPAGLQDLLPPDAGWEAQAVGGLLACFRGQGYEQVKPPMLEFEESLLSGPGAALTAQTFRLMDPVSQRMMGLRADMTPQVARLAGSRLANAPRPLRLCYAGQVLQVRGSQLRPERQFTQAGAEIIGADQEAADVEVILLAAEALQAIGVPGLSVDLNSPPLVATIAADLGFEAAKTRALTAALDGKDAAGVADLAGEHAPLFRALLDAAGPAEAALRRLADMDLPDGAAAEVARLERVVGLIAAAMPKLGVTLDPVEHRGFEYHSGISFIFFARGVRGELGRGGRYESQYSGNNAEPSTGFSLFMDTVMRALPERSSMRRVFAPFGTARARLAELRAQGWVTVCGLAPVADPAAEAARVGCTHLLGEEGAVALGEARQPERKD